MFPGPAWQFDETTERGDPLLFPQERTGELDGCESADFSSCQEQTRGSNQPLPCSCLTLLIGAPFCAWRTSKL